MLIVDDEEDIRELVAGILSDEGHETRTAYDSDSALAAISDRVPRLIFLDIWLQGSKLDGLGLLDEIRKLHPDLPVVMISGHGTIETARFGDPSRRLRLHREAVQGGSADSGLRTGAGDIEAAARASTSRSGPATPST